MSIENKKRVIIIGGGYAGVSLMHKLKTNNNCQITLIDKSQKHLYINIYQDIIIKMTSLLIMKNIVKKMELSLFVMKFVISIINKIMCLQDKTI